MDHQSGVAWPPALRRRLGIPALPAAAGAASASTSSTSSPASKRISIAVDGSDDSDSDSDSDIAFHSSTPLSLASAAGAAVPTSSSSTELRKYIHSSYAALTSIQRQLHRGEESYFEETYWNGNIFMGWDNIWIEHPNSATGGVSSSSGNASGGGGGGTGGGGGEDGSSSSGTDANNANAKHHPAPKLVPIRKMPADHRWFSSSCGTILPTGDGRVGVLERPSLMDRPPTPDIFVPVVKKEEAKKEKVKKEEPKKDKVEKEEATNDIAMSDSVMDASLAAPITSPSTKEDGENQPAGKADASSKSAKKVLASETVGSSDASHHSKSPITSDMNTTQDTTQKDDVTKETTEQFDTPLLPEKEKAGAQSPAEQKENQSDEVPMPEDAASSPMSIVEESSPGLVPHMQQQQKAMEATMNQLDNQTKESELPVERDIPSDPIPTEPQKTEPREDTDVISNQPDMAPSKSEVDEADSTLPSTVLSSVDQSQPKADNAPEQSTVTELKASEESEDVGAPKENTPIIKANTKVSNAVDTQDDTPAEETDDICQDGKSGTDSNKSNELDATMSAQPTTNQTINTPSTTAMATADAVAALEGLLALDGGNRAPLETSRPKHPPPYSSIASSKRPRLQKDDGNDEK